MVSPTPFDPELEQILRDIAKDPRSCLLRVDRPGNPATLADSWEGLSHWTPGLTAAERELLATHRAETALLLRQRWMYEVTTRPPEKFSLARSSGLAASSDAHAAEGHIGRKEQVQMLIADGVSDLASTLVDIEEDRVLDALSLSGLLVMAERIQPQASNRVMLAQDLVLNGQPRSAISLLRRSLQYETRPIMKGYMWHNLGLASGAMGNLHAASVCYERASRQGEATLATVGYWLLLAVQTGNLLAGFEAAEQFGDVAKNSDRGLLTNFCQEQRRTRSEGAWAPTVASAQTLERVRGNANPACQEALHVLE